ncbi:MAG: 2,3,4,5-tetrahydropyridine-2,6-dicarboxylate N-succinyltransferase, partial [Actinomycetes bacterium]
MTTDTFPPAPPRAAFGIGLATVSDADGRVLDVRYPRVGLGWDPLIDSRLGIEGAGLVEVPSNEAFELVGSVITNLVGADLRRGVHVRFIALHVGDLDAAPADTYDAYLRLHLLSARLVQPRTINLDGIFGLLSNVVWTNFGPCSVENFEATRLHLMQDGPVTIYGVDKFPRMVDYVTPVGVRIA